MKQIIIAAVVSVLLSSLASQGMSYSLLQTPSDHLLETGHLDLSIKSGFFRDRMGFDHQRGSDFLINGPAINIKLGLGRNAEFELNWDVLRFTEDEENELVSDFSDVSFFTKIRFLKESHWPSFGLRVGAKLPNASDETRAGTDLADTFAWVIMGKQLGPVHLFSNMGLEILGRKGGGQRDAFGYGLALSYDMTRQLSTFSEFSGRYERSGSPVNQSIIGVGLSYLFGTDWRAHTELSWGLISQSETFGVRAGLTKSFQGF